MKALLLLLLATPAMAMDPKVDCTSGGSGLYEQSVCKDRNLAELRQRLLEYLPASAVGEFDMSAVRICQGAWAPSKQVVIYPLVVRNCLQTLMETALEEAERGSNRDPDGALGDLFHP